MLGSVFKNTMNRNSTYEESNKIEDNLPFRRSNAIAKKNKVSFLRSLSRRVIGKFTGVANEELEMDDTQKS